MNLEKKIELISQVGEEIVTLEELRELLQKNPHPVAYDGFEPSGQMHIAQGLLRAINVNKMLKAGVHFKVLVADWFAMMNNKLNGDLEKIRITGEYFIELWKACGMETEKVEFIWSRDLVRKEGHWKTTLDIARSATLQRIIRCSQIMGRRSTDKLTAAQIIYPCMQAADIFHLKCDMTQLGMDQRKVNILAREIGPKLGFWKPVIVSHHMLLGLSKPSTNSKDPADKILDLKMSKSKPDSAIFMTDPAGEVERKISKAYCPEKETKENPILEYCRYIIFEKFKAFTIERPSKFGGNVSFESYAELENAYAGGKIHPADLKKATAVHIDRLLDPVRKHFEKDARARELLEKVNKLEVTR